ncbi:hypothetical protein [Polyangium jinanense]|uniref:Uncharacterized protein n=1 Tax=Polyangium jinanense TaxID=2829994 RepID=A0A9X4ASH3_9BACT|nr:hypothetical protein [Polyangium jinanense]MDC3955824.1 hypothetical protein [Polyangium jinanense]MDC3983183.1 hypothetical protein [Polyangium jinanense]
MQIDRSRFLLLTATMASGACGGAAQPGAGDPVVAAPVVTLPEEDKPAESRTTAGSPGQPGVGEPSEEVRATLEGAGSSSGDEPSVCDDGGPAPKGCDTLRAPGPQCESFIDTRDMCGKLAHGLKPRVAEKVVDCLLAKSGKQSLCTFDIANQCGMSAVRKASCIEPSTQSACAPAVKSCGGRLAMKDCQALLSSVNRKNRENMLACVTEGCSIDYCMYSVE